MNKTVDARGLSCPQPVLMTLSEMTRMESGKITVLVDTDTSKENVIRAAGSKGWDVTNIEGGESEYKITLSRG